MINKENKKVCPLQEMQIILPKDKIRLNRKNYMLML